MNVTLEKYNMSDIVNYYAETIADNLGVSKKQAKALFLNALTYNCVEEEVLSQASWMFGENEEA